MLDDLIGKFIFFPKNIQTFSSQQHEMFHPSKHK